MAEVIGWDDSCLVGLDEIDEQHKVLFDLYNSLLSAYRAKDKVEGKSVVNHAFEEMTNYLEYHFSTEEKIWRRDESIFPEHRKLHSGFVKYVLQATVNDSDFESLGALLDFLSTWLLDHIQTVDKRQFQELRDKGLL